MTSAPADREPGRRRRRHGAEPSAHGTSSIRPQLAAHQVVVVGVPVELEARGRAGRFERAQQIDADEVVQHVVEPLPRQPAGAGLDGRRDLGGRGVRAVAHAPSTARAGPCSAVPSASAGPRSHP